MKTISFRQLAYQLDELKNKREFATWKEIDTFEDTFKDKCFKINNEEEARFIIWLIEYLFWYEFYSTRRRGEVISGSSKYWYIVISRSSCGWSVSDYISRPLMWCKLDWCSVKDIWERYERVTIKELEVYRWNDVRLLIQKMFEEWLI